MRLVLIFSLFFSFYSYSRNLLHYQKLSEKRQAGPSAQKEVSVELESITEKLQEGMKRLLFTLTHEHTSEEKKLRIIETLSETALLNNKVEETLKGLVARGSECENEEEQVGCRIIDIVSLEAHAELMRRRADSLAREDQENWDYYKDMAISGALIITGIGLVFIPVGGPVLTTALFTARYATLSKAIGASVVTGIGLYQVDREIATEEEGEDLRNIFELVKDVAGANVLTTAIFHFAQLGDKDLLEQIVLSSSEEELMELFYRVIEDGSRSDETRRVAVEALLAFPEELQIRRTRTTQLLMEMADKNPNDLALGVRISAVKALGKIGERASEVAEYLNRMGKGESEESEYLNRIGKRESEELEFLIESEDQKEIEDELRLIVLVQSGRNKAYFDKAIQTLAEWIDDSRSEEDNESFLNNLEIQLEIPKSFLNAFLSAKEEKIRQKGLDSENKVMKQLENHIIVLKEFISSGILDIETKLKLSEILIDWTKNSPNSPESLEIKAFLGGVWTNPAEDTLLYVRQLEAKNPTEENKPAFEFLKGEISKRKGIKNTTIALEEIEKIIGDTGPFYEKYPNQTEILEKIKIFLGSYKKMIENIKEL